MIPLRHRPAAAALLAALLLASPAAAGEDVFTRTLRFHLETGDLLRAEAVVRNVEESGEDPELAARLRRMLEEARGGPPAPGTRPAAEPAPGRKPPAPAPPGAPARRAPPKKSGRMQYVEALLAQGKTREVLLNLVELAPAEPHAALLLGKLRFAEGKPEEAAGLLAGALESLDDAEGAFLAGLAARRLGRNDEARRRFREGLALDPVSAAHALALGNLERALGRPDEARKAYLEALRRDPALVEAHLGMADALDMMGDEEEAVRAYTYVLKTFKTGHDTAYLGLARTLFRKGRYDECLKLLAKAEEIFPGNAQAKAMRAAVKLRKGDRRGAEEALRETLKLAPGDAASRDGLIDLLLARRAYAEAKEELKRALKADPENGRHHYRLGVLYSGEKESGLAERHLTLALQKGYSPVETRAALAILRERQGRLMEAQALYERAREDAQKAGDTRHAQLLGERVEALGGRIWKKERSPKPKKESPETGPAEIIPGVPMPDLDPALRGR